MLFDTPATRFAHVFGAVALAAGLLSLTGCGEDAVPAAAAPTANAEAEPPQRDEQATLDIYCEPPTPILLDGKPIGKSPLKAVKVSPGAHDVTFADEVSGNRTMSVRVEAGENRSVISDKPKSSQDVTPGSKPTETKTK